MGQILPEIEHLIVVMLENRSFDNLCGWLYDDGNSPQNFVPSENLAPFDGLNPSFWNPSNSSYFQGQPPQKVFVEKGASTSSIPDPDPEEEFDHITFQIYGPEEPSPSPRFPMQGFLVDYQSAGPGDASKIMQGYTPDQVSVLSSLARNYAISDRWFCSTPNQTWPNRCFVHAGTANGNVNNGALPNPFDWDVTTIFNVLESMGKSWSVYSDTTLIPSLTRIMAPKLWSPLLDDHFKGFDAFLTACSAGKLPSYNFIEPSFLVSPNDGHPPHDMDAAEAFVFAIWDAVSQSSAWSKTLLVITFDEHGGCYDHVLPPTNATTPDPASDPGTEGFRFDRFGVRVPTIFVSPFIEPGTLVRAAVDSQSPFDHTTILATLRDWLSIPPEIMLPSRRILSAPTLGQILNRTIPRADLPPVPRPNQVHSPAFSKPELPLNARQKSMVAGAARMAGMDPVEVVQMILTRGDLIRFFEMTKTTNPP